jgi:hypothetical protein
MSRKLPYEKQTYYPLTPQAFENLLTSAIAKSMTEVRRFVAVDKQDKPRPPLTNSEIVGDFCNWLRRELKCTALEELPIAKPAMWFRVGVPHNYGWNFLYKTTEGDKRMTALHAEQICSVAARKSLDSKSMEEEFRDINVQMTNLFTELIQLQTLGKRAVSINDEADVVLGNLCKVAEKLNS